MADHSRALTELCNAVAAQSGVLLLADADGALQPMATAGRRGSEARVGVSGGLAVYPENGRTATLLLQASDAAMYSAKRARPGKKDRPVAGPEATAAPMQREVARASAPDYTPVPTMATAAIAALPVPTAG